MKTKWPWVRESQIFDLGLRKTFRDDFSENNSQFEQFNDAIQELIKRKENIRIQTHGQYLLGVILEASNVLSEALTAIQEQIDGNDFTFQQCTEFITKTEEAIRTVRETLQKEINKVIKETAQTCYDSMSRDDGKDVILNPPNHLPILQKDQSKIPEEINDLVRKHVDKFLRSSDVLKKFRGVRGKIVSFYHNISTELSKMENEWTYDRESNVSVCEALVTSPLCLPDFTIPVLTLSWIQMIPPSNIEIKQHLIDGTYNPYLSIIRGSICNHLKSSYGQVIMKLLDTVTNNLLSKRLNHLKKIIDQYQGDREKYLVCKQKLERLALDVKRLQETATELHSMTQVEEANNGML